MLVEFNDFNTIMEKIKIIDFSSSLHHSELGKFSIQCSIPEYLPPEILEFADDRWEEKLKDDSHDSQEFINLGRDDLEYRTEELISKSHPWSIDVWSLGVMVLEIAHGIPIWLSTPTTCRLANGTVLKDKGLFGIPSSGKHNKRTLNSIQQI